MSKRKRLPRKRWTQLVQRWEKASRIYYELDRILMEVLSEEAYCQHSDESDATIVQSGHFLEDLDEMIENCEDTRTWRDF